MPRIVNFNNRQIVEPGAYSQIKSGIPVPAVLGTYGNVMIIDTGSGRGYGYGSGINGEINEGAQSIYEFNSLEEAKRALRGGKLYDLMDYLWSPTSSGNGPRKVFYARAATTEAAKFHLVLGSTKSGTPETRAVATLTVNESGLSTVYTITIDGVTNALVNVNGNYSTTALAATAIASLANNNNEGWEFEADGSDINVTAPVGSGNNFNGAAISLTQVNTNGTTSSSSNVSGGVDLVPDTVQGSVMIYTKSEGSGANGNVINGVLTTGYGLRLRAGIVDPDALIVEFFEGQYRGVDSSNVEYDISESAVTNYVLCRSSEFKSVNELVAWMNSDSNFNEYFYIPIGQIVASSAPLNPEDEIDEIGTDILEFEDGSTAYNPSDVDAVLSNIEDLDNSMFLCDDYGPIPSPAWEQEEILDGVNKGAMSVANTKILSYIKNSSTYTEKAMYIGGGDNANKFNVPAGAQDGSLQIAKYYDDPSVVVVHSGVKVPSTSVSNGIAYKYLPSLYHAALICGRVAGLEPQVPVTYKNIRVIGVSHLLKKSERELALKSGVLHTRYQTQMGWIVNQGVNSLQLNSNLITASGKSPEIQIMRIIHQINKELVINATPRFVGGNLNTASAEDVKLFVEGYLTDRTATRNVDNLIITFNSVKVTLVQDYWEVTYCFVPNSPINRLFFTGFILDPKIQL